MVAVVIGKKRVDTKNIYQEYHNPGNVKDVLNLLNYYNQFDRSIVVMLDDEYQVLADISKFPVLKNNDLGNFYKIMERNKK